jgi:predicted RNA-binding protein with PUA-like domain
VLAAPGRITPWTGVRNYQARNYMRDQMRIGDGVLFYHSSCPEPGVAGLAEVASAPYVDPSQFDRKGDYYDAKATREAPRWFCVDVRAKKKTRVMPLAEMHAQPGLKNMLAMRPGNRLSITPVTPAEWKLICNRLR